MLTIEAIVITAPGFADVLKPVQRTIAFPGEGEVLIEVMAAGVNRPDLLQRKGQYPVPPGLPADIPGLEVAGVIHACGPGVQRWKKGDAVCALLGGGGYATYALANARHCLPVPRNWTYPEACSLPETVFTVWHNVFQRGRLAPGERLLVHGGSSGIGITAIQLAKLRGSQVVATAGSAEKCKACLDLGADKCINYKEEDFEAVLKNDPLDLVLDMIGGDYAAKNIRLLREEGRLVFINTMNGNQLNLDARLVMQRRLTITGSTLRSRSAAFKASLAREVEENVWPLFEDRRFRPVIHSVFPLAAAADAHRLMESSQHIGKIVLEINR